LSDKSSTSSRELKEIDEFVEYIEKVVRESDIGLSPKSVEMIKRKYFELKMKAKIEIEAVPKFMENVAFSKMKELDFLELRLETALQLASDKYTLQEMRARCDSLKNAVEIYKAMVAVIFGAVVWAILSRFI